MSRKAYDISDLLIKYSQGDDTDFSRLHHRDVISYTRLNRGKMDIFYLVEDGDIVYDLLEKIEIKPPRGLTK